MVKCPLCEREFANGRGLHAHMLKSHLEEYRKKGCKIKNFGVVADYGPSRGKPPAAPEGLRPLNRTDNAESAAYVEGYRFICGEDVYTTTECKEKGWI